MMQCFFKRLIAVAALCFSAQLSAALVPEVSQLSFETTAEMPSTSETVTIFSSGLGESEFISPISGSSSQSASYAISFGLYNCPSAPDRYEANRCAVGVDFFPYGATPGSTFSATFTGTYDICYDPSCLEIKDQNRSFTITVTGTYGVADSDGDGVDDNSDQCPATATGAAVNSQGCSSAQIDSDGDDVNNDLDECSDTPAGSQVNAQGCAESQLDTDNDGVTNDRDQCPLTGAGLESNANGCALNQLDSDRDGVSDADDQCPTQSGSGSDGCPGYSDVLDSLQDAAGGDETLGVTAGAVADSCTSGVSGQLDEDCRALIDASLSGADGVGTALSEITPERATQANASVQKSNSVQNRNIGDRISALRGGTTGISFKGLSFNLGGQQLGADQMVAWADDMLTPAGGASADEEESMLLANSRWGVFLSGEISRAERDAEGASSGLDVDSSVITGGLDYRLSDNWVLGGAISFINGETELANNKGYVDSDGVSFTVYGSYFLDKFYLDFSVSRGESEFEQSRRIGYVLGNGTQVGQFMLADYDGTSTSAFVGVGWDLVQTEWLVSLRATLDYLDSEVDSFTERASDPTGSGAGWAVIMDEQNQDWVTGRLTGSASRVFSTSWGVLIPYAEIDWVEEFGNDQFLVNAHFVADPTGDALQVLSDDPDTSYFRGRVGASVQLPNGFSAFLDYGRLFSYDRWSEYTISGGLRYEF